MNMLYELLHLLFLTQHILCFKSEERMTERIFETRLIEMKNDLFNQVIQTSIEEEILASMPKEEAEGHLKRDSRSKRVLRSIQSDGCKNALDDNTCKYLRLNGECKLKGNEMKLYCPEKCGFCGNKLERCMMSQFGCCADGKTMAKGKNFAGCPENCQDKKSRRFCKIVRRLSMCLTEGTLHSCEKTCGYCRSCEDDNKFKCYYAEKYGSCKTLKSTMINECRKSCKYCGTNDPCHNHPCPLHSSCIVDMEGKPSCVCHKKCHKGDHHTGPVCGRNGVTYNNLCELKRSVCHRYHHVTVRRYGKCNHKLRALRSVHCKKIKKDSPDCKLWKLSGFCETKKNQMTKLCARTCNFCVNQYPQPPCHYSKYGCCLDNKTPCLGEGYQGCPNRRKICKDKSKILCRRFVALCGHEKHADFLKNFCPKTCLFC